MRYLQRKKAIRELDSVRTKVSWTRLVKESRAACTVN